MPSIKRDSTAITAFAWDRAAKKARLVFHRIFTPKRQRPHRLRDHDRGHALGLKQRFRLSEVRFDPWGMQASAQRLSRNGVKMVEFPQSPGNLTEASQNLYELITGRTSSLIPTLKSVWRSLAPSPSSPQEAGGSTRPSRATRSTL